MSRVISIVLLLLSLVLATGCSSSKVVLPLQKAELPPDIYVDSIEIDQHIAREHSDLLEESIRASLVNKGYLITNAPPSSLRARVNISQLERRSILLGHLNTISGRIDLHDDMGKPVLAVEHTEVERGGILFNTGQLLKGIQSEINNATFSAFTQWLRNFSNGLLSELPTPMANRAEYFVEPMLGTVHYREDPSKTLCASGTPALRMTLKTRLGEFPLAEREQGHYCLRLPSYLSNGMLSESELILTSQHDIQVGKKLTGVFQQHPCQIHSLTANLAGDRITFQSICSGEVSRSCDLLEVCEGVTLSVFSLRDNAETMLLLNSPLRNSLSVSSENALSNQFEAYLLYPGEQYPFPVSVNSVVRAIRN